jgi:hypothetical protein
VRHVRMLGLCLAALLVVSGIAAVSANATAIATNGEKYKTTPKIFENCPVEAEAPETPAGYNPLGLHAGNGNPRQGLYCTYAFTNKGEGHFTVGPFSVPFTRQVVLQYGYWRFEPNAEGHAEGKRVKEIYAAPIHGVEAIAPTPEPVPGEPIAHLTSAEQEELGWPESLKHRYLEGQKAHSVKTVYETIELAGIPFTSSDDIVNEEGVGVEAPVKIKGENKWVSELGDVCYIGSEEAPIVQHLTSGETTSPLTGETIHGSGGDLEDFAYGKKVNGHREGLALVLVGSTLDDNTYPVPSASCSGPYSGYIQAAIDKVFGIPAVAGASVTELTGQLYLTTAEDVFKDGI